MGALDNLKVRIAPPLEIWAILLNCRLTSKRKRNAHGMCDRNFEYDDAQPMNIFRLDFTAAS